MRRKLAQLVAVVLPLGAMVTMAARPSVPQATPGATTNVGQRMTNAEVIRLVKEHRTDAQIIREINAAKQAGTADFDLSPNALIALHGAGVSNEVLKAMMADSGAKTGAPNSGSGTGNGSPLPGTPGNAPRPTPQQSQKMLAQLKLRPGHLSQMITNPQADQMEAGALAALGQSGPVASQPAHLLDSTPGTAGGNSDPAGTPAGGSTPPGGVGGSGQPGGTGSTPTRASTGTVGKKPTLLIPGATPPAKGSAGIPATIPKGASLNPCAVNNVPVVTAVSGYRIGLNAFSQDPTWNPYTIAGCNFGNNQGHAFLSMPSGAKFTDLAIRSWTDAQIKVSVDSNLLDILDQDNVILTIVTSSGQQSQKAGLKFHALRREVQLRDVPKSQITLSAVKDTGGLGVEPYYSSPFWGLGYSTAIQARVSRAVGDAEVNNADKGMTAGVDRNAWYRFSGGTDVYDFTKLKPGFYVSRFQIDGRNLQQCPGSAAFSVGAPNETDYQDGSWNAQYYVAQNQIHVDWQEKHCHLSIDDNDSSNSTYGLNVWVKGPAIRPQASPWQEGLK